MPVVKLKLAFLLLCCAVVSFEIWHMRHSAASNQESVPATSQSHEPLFALLPESEIAAYAERFAVPKANLQAWEPTVADINDLESNLPQISVLSGTGTEHIDHPDSYFRQYLAVVVNGKKSIFVNALCTNKDHLTDWRKRLVFVHDGGKCFWHVTYDPATQKFTDLEINGVA
jgi:hypothetical protein